MPGDRVVGRSRPELNNTSTLVQCTSLPGARPLQSSSQGRSCAEPHQAELDVVSLSFFRADGDGAWGLLGCVAGEGQAGPRQIRLLEGFRTVPTTLPALMSEPSGTLSQPSGQS